MQRKLRALQHTAPPSGNLRDAVTYANGRWPHLVRYAPVTMGHVHIDSGAHCATIFMELQAGRFEIEAAIGQQAAGLGLSIVRHSLIPNTMNS